jgi:DDE domain
VLDYLTQEVLARQPEPLVRFLLETSILERLSGPLCDVVTTRSDSQQLLEQTERANLFLVPLDEVRGWWRYHHLFADLLRARLQQTRPERVPELQAWMRVFTPTTRGAPPDSGHDRRQTTDLVGHCCSCCDRVGSRQTAAMRTRRPRSAAVARSAFAGFCFPPDVIVLAVRWYLRFALSYRNVEELLAERGVQVDHGTIYRWVQRFTPLLADAAAARRFFERALGATKITPVEVITDQAATYPVVLEELLPAAWHRTDRYANNGVECDYGRLKARLGPMRGSSRIAAPGS